VASRKSITAGLVVAAVSAAGAAGAAGVHGHKKNESDVAGDDSLPITDASPVAASAPTNVQQQVRSEATAEGYSAADAEALSKLVDHESDWNPHGKNASTGAYGPFQALPGSKMAQAGSDWHDNPKTQTKWGLKYIKERYGSPSAAWAFWQKHRWF